MTKITHSQFQNHFSRQNALILCVSILLLHALFTSMNTQSKGLGRVCPLDPLASQKCETTCAYRGRKWGSVFNCFVVLKAITQACKCLLLSVFNILMSDIWILETLAGRLKWYLALNNSPCSGSKQTREEECIKIYQSLAGLMLGEEAGFILNGKLSMFEHCCLSCVRALLFKNGSFASNEEDVVVSVGYCPRSSV